MNAMVTFRTNAAGTLNPTPEERKEAVEKVWSNLKAMLQGAQASSQQSTANAVTTKSTTSDSITSAVTGDELGRDAFLQLMVMQMQYQDPMSPMDNEDMIAQLAQFSALEQMQNLNSSFEEFRAEMTQQGLVSASTLLGRTVTGIDTSGVAVEGEVYRVFANNGEIYVGVGDSVVNVTNLEEVV